MAAQGQEAGESGEKTRVERFLERLTSEGRTAGSRGGDKLKAFMANADEIRGALDAGFSVKDVWQSLRESGEVVLSYSLFSQYVKSKLRLEPRRRFEQVGVIPKGEVKASEPELTAEEKHYNELVYGTPTGRQG